MTNARLILCVAFLTLVGLVVAQPVDAQNLSVAPQSLNFSYQIGGASPPVQSLFISAASPANFSVTVSGAPWLTVVPSTGVTPSNLTVTATPPANATPQVLTGQIIIGPPASADNLKLVVPVTLQILQGGPGDLVVNPKSLAFDYRVGGPVPQQVSIAITTTTGAPGTFAVAASTISGGNWLAVNAPSFQTPATAWAYIVPPTGIAPGTYTGTITIIPGFSGGTTQYIPVTLRVSANGQLNANPTSMTFSYQTGGLIPGAQVLTVTNASGGAVPFTATATTSSGGIWLNVSPSASTTPSSIVISTSPTPLAPGTYYGTVNLAPTYGGVVTQVPVSLTVYNSSQFIVEPSSLSFQYKQTDVTPAPQYLSIRSTGGPITFNAGVAGPSWITLSTTSAATPTGMAVFVNPLSTTAPGRYDASVVLTPTTGGVNPVSIPVSVQVIAANSLSVGRSSVVFDYSVGGPTPASALISVNSTPNPARFSLVISPSGSNSWLKASQSGPSTPATVTITVSPQNLNPGQYKGTVTVVSDEVINSPQNIDVTLNVSREALPAATPFGLVFSYQMSGAVPPQQAVVISSNLGAAVPFTIGTETTTGGNWLRASGASTTPGTIIAGVDPANLGPGTYTGNILIKPNSSPDTPLHVLVILNVSPSPVFLPSANLLTFQSQSLNPYPPAQTVKINSSDGSAIVFYPTSKTADGTPWLKATPDFATTPADLTVSVNTQGVPLGRYYGIVILTDAALDSPATYLPVTLQSTDAAVLSVPFQTLVFNGTSNGGSTATQKIAFRTSPAKTAFQVSTNGASWLLVNPPSGSTDDTAQATLSVAASSDGLSAGTYLGVLTLSIPGVSDSQQHLPVVFTVK